MESTVIIVLINCRQSGLESQGRQMRSVIARDDKRTTVRSKNSNVNEIIRPLSQHAEQAPLTWLNAVVISGGCVRVIKSNKTKYPT